MTRAALFILLFGLPACRLPNLPFFGAGDDASTRRVVFHGNKSFDDITLRKALAPYREQLAGREFPDALADDVAYEVVLHYLGAGFAFATVDYQVIPHRDGARMLLRIQEGPRVKLADVRLEGVLAFDEREVMPLFRAVEIDPLELEAVGLGSTWYVRRNVEAAASDLVSLYQDRGYLDAALAGLDVAYNKARTEATVTVRFLEGPRYTVGDLQVRGNLEGLGEQARRAAGLFAGDAYTPWRAAEARARVLDYYTRRGYLFARAQLIEDEPAPAPAAGTDAGAPRAAGAGRHGGTRVFIKIFVDAGERRRLRQIALAGLKKSDPATVLGIADLPQGEILTRGSIRRAYRRLAGSGLYRTVEVLPEVARQEPDRVDVTIKVEERPSTIVGVLGGYGSYERTRVGLDLHDRNLWGLGLAAGVSGKRSEKAWQLRTDLSNRYFLGSDFQDTLSATLLSREEVSFLREERGLENVLAYDVTRRLRVDLTYRFTVTDATRVEGAGAVTSASDPVFAERGATTSAVSFGARWDLRDRATDPHEGFLFYARAENAGSYISSEQEFLRLTGGATALFPFLGGHTLALGLRGGTIQPLSDTTAIGIQDRFFSGGSTTVRSFDEGRLGPSNAAGTPTGGEAFTVINAELRLTVSGNWGLVIFGDAGKVEKSFNEVGFSDLRYAVGGGLRYRTPMGPIRLDFGHNPSRHKGEPTSIWFFSVGHPF